MTQVKKATRLSKAAREFNVGISTIVEYLHKKGLDVDSNPNTKLPAEAYEMLVQEFSSDISVKKESEKLSLKNLQSKQESVSIDDVEESEKPDSEGSDEEILIKDVTEQEAESVSPEEKQAPVEKEEEPAAEEKKEEKAPEVEEEKAVPEKKQEPAAKEEKQKKAEDKKQEKPEKEEKEEKGAAAGTNGPTVVGKIDLENLEKKKKKKPAPKTTEKEKKEEKVAPKKEKASEKKKVEKADKTAPEEKPETKKPAAAADKKEEKPGKKKKPAAEKPKTEEEKKPAAKPEKEDSDQKKEEDRFITTRVERLSGPTVVGKIQLPDKPKKKEDEKKKKPVASSSAPPDSHKKKRKRIRKDKEKVDLKDEGQSRSKKGKTRRKKSAPARPEVSEEDVQKQIKETLARLTSKGKSKGSRYRREKRETISQKQKVEEEKAEQEKNILRVTEFVSVNELANLMDIPATNVISTCMNLGLFVSINQRLDAETIVLVADEFGYQVEFISVEVQESVEEEDQDDPAKMKPRPPIVTVMGHVDHGKTKLLDYIRNTNVVAGEAGGITQHIGAYSVEPDENRKLTFLDTPGHEAFTAMRARGAQITDIAIIVIAADDGVKPQTKEAINHAAAAGVPIVFAINKIDKPTANTEKIKEELANMNFLVEDWGGKYQSQEISAKSGINIDELLEKVLLEAELLELKANADKSASGVVIESTLDRGRGYIATILVETGTLYIGDVILAGHYFGHVKAMFNERGKDTESAGPATPVLILGLNGAPQAGDRFNIMASDREAKEAAVKREQLQRQQTMRTKKHITLDEIGRRIAIGNFQELNIIVKGDVDGSVEALSDSLEKLSTEEIQVNIKHKGVGAISEPDILLAAASNAVVIGFNVRPTTGARKFAEKEEIDIRLYSIIYDAIEEIKAAMEGMLSPEVREEIVATLEVQDTFKITKVGTIAGCMVKEGKISRNSKVRLIRDGIVIYSGKLGSLKRYKDDVKEVVGGLECGLNIENYNDVKVGDQIEAYKEYEVKKKL